MNTSELINLKRFRKSNKLKQSDIADYLDVSREYISQVENNKCKLSEENVRKLLDSNWDTSLLLNNSEELYMSEPEAQYGPSESEKFWREITASQQRTIESQARVIEEQSRVIASFSSKASNEAV